MFYQAEKLITGIDISDNTLKVISVSKNAKNGNVSVVDCARLPSEDDKTIAKEIRSFISRNKITRSYFLVSFPRHLVTIKNIRLPAVSDSEIKSMAELQAIKYLPYSRDEIVVSYKVISATSEGYSEILLVLVQRKLVERYVNVFKAAGIKIDKLCLSSEGILNWYIKSGKTAGGSAAIIDADRYHTHIQIIKGNDLVFSRSISLDAAFIERDKNNLLKEIRMSFETYSKERNEGVAAVFASGAEDYAKSIYDILCTEISAPCEIIRQEDYIKGEGLGGQALALLKENSYTALLGLTIMPDRAEINLIPEEILEKRKLDTAKRELTKSVILILCALVAFFAILEKKMLEKRFYLEKLEGKIKSITPEVERLSRLKESAEIIDAQLTFTGSSIDVIREIYKIIPKDISLTLLEFEGNKRLLLRGTAKELSTVFNFLPVLEKSPYFENAKINYATKRTFKSVDFADFEIICQLAKF